MFEEPFYQSYKYGQPSKCQSHPQIPSSHKEKRSGEPSQISWAIIRFSGSVTQQRSNYFVENPLKKSMDTRMEMNNVDVVREVLRNNQRSCNLIGLPPSWGKSPRNWTSFTRPFLTGRRVWGGHETRPLHAGPTINTGWGRGSIGSSM